MPYYYSAFVATNQLTKRATSDLKELPYIVLSNQATNPLTLIPIEDDNDFKNINVWLITN